MTLEEKASLCSGENFWETKAVKRLGIPSIMMTDGPHGLRKQAQQSDHLGLYESIPSTCFPAGCATASSFDEELLEKMGRAMAVECIANDVSIVLGPGTNIKRSPVCGRNFEYFSEDPLLATKISTAHIKGVQSLGVGTSLKHYVANEQETLRMTISSEVDERTLREIYLSAFEGAVKEAQPTTVMCAYNKVNGEYASENKYLLTDILRDEWGFEGFVVSDWGAVNDRVKGLVAGLELQMPATKGANDALIVQAVKVGELDEAILDKAVERLLKVTFSTLITEEQKVNNPLDLDKNNEIARMVSSESAVLLKNDDSLLPVKSDAKVAFIGEFFERPRFQGGGSSHINPYKVTSAKDSMERYSNSAYAKGFEIDNDEIDDNLLNEAIKLAQESEVCVIFAGLPDRYESEGYDRRHMRLPDNQIRLIEEIAKVQQNCVIVLHNGSPIEMPWISKVKSVLEMYLGGQATGVATMDILSGVVNPSGKLAETFPLRFQDNPSYISFPGNRDKVEYREGIFVGYRYYDKKEMPVLFPFGHGMSYTTFSYSNLTVSHDKAMDSDEVVVTVNVENTGICAGKEVVQLYIAPKCNLVERPIKELKGFKKVSLNSGESETVFFTLNKRSFAFYDVDKKDWRVEDGVYEILVGASSRDIRLSKEIHVSPTKPYERKLTVNTPMGELMDNPKGAVFLKEILKDSPLLSPSAQEDKDEMFTSMVREMPLRAGGMFSGMLITQKQLDEALK